MADTLAQCRIWNFGKDIVCSLRRVRLDVAVVVLCSSRRLRSSSSRPSRRVRRRRRRRRPRPSARTVVRPVVVVCSLSVRPRPSRHRRPFSVRPSRRPCNYYLHDVCEPNVVRIGLL